MEIDKILAEIGYEYGSENFDALNNIFIEKYKEYLAQKDNEDNQNEKFDTELIELHEQLHDVEELPEEIAKERTKRLLAEKKLAEKLKKEQKQKEEMERKKQEAEKKKQEAEENKKQEEKPEKKAEKSKKYLTEKDFEKMGIKPSTYMRAFIFPKSFEYEGQKYKAIMSPLYARWIKE